MNLSNEVKEKLMRIVMEEANIETGILKEECQLQIENARINAK